MSIIYEALQKTQQQLNEKQANQSAELLARQHLSWPRAVMQLWWTGKGLLLWFAFLTCIAVLAITYSQFMPKPQPATLVATAAARPHVLARPKLAASQTVAAPQQNLPPAPQPNQAAQATAVQPSPQVVQTAATESSPAVIPTQPAAAPQIMAQPQPAPVAPSAPATTPAAVSATIAATAPAAPNVILVPAVQMALNGIFIGGDERVAFINNNPYHVGDAVADMKIVAIEPSYVRLQQGDQIRELKMLT